MHRILRIEAALEHALAGATRTPCPPKLVEGMRHAVFGGGGRLRPRLTVLAAEALGDDTPHLTDAAAAAVELIHCASLVHDDLPAFDDADLRRGQPTVHRLYGEPLAVLTGDALIIRAFEFVAEIGGDHPDRMARIILALGQAAGAPRGITAGQGWESEDDPDLSVYHRLKTGALFEGAVIAGVVAAGGDPAPWRGVGTRLGEAYQVADDLKDLLGHAAADGKEVRRDVALGRPNAALQLGVEEAVDRMRALVDRALDAVPDLEGAAPMKHWIQQHLALAARPEEARA